MEEEGLWLSGLCAESRAEVEVIIRIYLFKSLTSVELFVIYILCVC